MATLSFDISMSVDGFIAGPNPSEETPWAREARSFTSG